MPSPPPFGTSTSDVRGGGGRHAAQFARICEDRSSRREARAGRIPARERRVVERQHIVFLRLGVEDILQLLELVRHLVGKIVVLGDIFIEVVEFPLIPGNHIRRRRGAQFPREICRRRDRHPTVLVNGAVPEHLEILRRVPGWRVGILLVQRVHHAHAFNRALLDAFDRVGSRDACRFEDRRYDVDDVMKLAADTTDVRDVAGPGHGHAIGSAAAMRRNLLHPLERSIHRPRPAGRIMRKGPIRSPEVVPEKLVLDRNGDAIEGRELVRCSVEHALGARAVVAAYIDDQGVVELAHVVDGLDNATDFVVGVCEERSVDVSLLDEEFFLLKTQGIPLRQFLRPRRQLGISGHDAEPLLVRKGGIAQFVPAAVE